jgi:acetyl esterase/lipase
MVSPLLQVLIRRRGWLALAAVSATAVSVGYAGLGTQQRKWIFQAARAPEATPAALEQAARAGGMESVWIEHLSPTTGRPIRLHALWAGHADPRAPLLLYLHGARRDVGRSTFRMEQMRELGFSVLAVDYRGFGNSTDELPSESGVVEDAEAAWRWLAEHRPGQPRYLFGHSLAARSRCSSPPSCRAPADTPQGVIVEAPSPRSATCCHLQVGLAAGLDADHRALRSLAAVPRIKSPL